MKKKNSKKQKNLLREKKILFYIFIFLAIIFFLSAAFTRIGDFFIRKDNYADAKTFYKIGKFLNPLDQKINTRLLAVDVMSSIRFDEGELGNIKKNQDAKSLKNTIKVPVLMYHYIRFNPNPKDIAGFHLSVTPYNFEKQMEYLSKNGFETIDLDQLSNALLYQKKLPKKPIVITFDDGYADCYTAAYPVLKKYNLKGVNFIPTGLIGAPNYLTWDHIQEMQSSKIMSFGAHTVHHSGLTYLSEHDAEKEIIESKNALEYHLGISVKWFAYPYGNYNNQVAHVVQKAGFTGSFSTVWGNLLSADSIFELPRVRIDGGDTLYSFIQKIEM